MDWARLIDLLKISRFWLRVAQIAFLASAWMVLQDGLEWTNTGLLVFVLSVVGFGIDQWELGGSGATYQGERTSGVDLQRGVGVTLLIAAAVLLSLIVFQTRDKYRVLSYSPGTNTATVRRVLSSTMLELRCYGSVDKGTNVKEPKYSTTPDKEGTWEGVVGTEHWNGGCRPLPIGFTVTFQRQKYPANYLEYNTEQEPAQSSRFSYSYWEIVAER